MRPVNLHGLCCCIYLHVLGELWDCLLWKRFEFVTKCRWWWRCNKWSASNISWDGVELHHNYKGYDICWKAYFMHFTCNSISRIFRWTPLRFYWIVSYHYNDVIMGAIASQITSLTIVYSTVYSGVDQRKHQSSASLALLGEIHRGPVNSPHKWPVTWKMFPLDDVIM